MIKNLLLDLDLGLIKEFLMLNIRRESMEIEKIISEYERGQYQGIDDLDNALFHPVKRLEISMRAVYYELISIIEWEIRLLACQIAPPLNKIRPIKSKDMFKISFSNIIKYFDAANIKMDNIPEYSTIQYILDIANSYKHRNGLKRFKEMRKIPEYHEIDAYNIPKAEKDILKAINDTRAFLIELKKRSKI